MAYILVARVCKNGDRETAQGGKDAGPSDDSNRLTAPGHIAFDEMRQHENNQVPNGNQCDEASVSERVQPAQVAQGYHDKPVEVYSISISISLEASTSARRHDTHMNAVIQKRRSYKKP